MRQELSNHRASLSTIATWAMFSRGLEPEFDVAVHKQVALLEGPARENDPQIKDLTHLPWCSIDNDDSRDLDQLTAIEAIGVNQMRVYVAIADVDALVKKGSAIDAHARHNTTSVYTSARIFPMLPERLCTDFTSLNQDQDRLALVVEMVFSDDGFGVSSTLYRAMVRNKAQLAYDAVSAWMEGHAALPEPARLPRQPDGQALQAFLAYQHQADPLRFPDLSLVIVKLMGSGEYVVEDSQDQAIGHFALAVQDYMHSTAPNRRYPDLLTLRLIKAALSGSPAPYTMEELIELAEHCTAQENAAQKVERQMRKSEAALLLHSRLGQRFDALVTGAADDGAWVRIFDPPAEGRLRGDVSDLGVGQTLRVKLVSTSVERGFIDFEPTR